MIDWPASIAGAPGVIAPAERAPFTVTLAELDVTIWEGEPLSFTCNSNDQTPDVNKTPVETVGLSPATQVNEPPKLPKLASSGPLLSHWQASGLVPPLNEVVVEIVDNCPAPIVGGLAAIAGGVIAALTVTRIEIEVTVTDGDPASLTWISNDHDPTVVRTPVEVEAGDVQPEGLPRVVKAVAPGAFSSHWQM